MASKISESAGEPLADFGGDDLGGGGAATVAGHDGAAFDAEGVGFGVHYTLEDGDAFVADFLDFRLDVDAVVVVNLGTEVDIIVDDHDGEVALGGREAMRGEEGILAEVEVLHDDGVVDMTHLVDVIKANLYVCDKHN